MSNKTGRYERITMQLEGLLTKTSDPVACMSTINAILYHKMNSYFWVGFYLLKGDELIVGPYQGPVACQVLKKDIGVCWAVIKKREYIIVPDVEEFPGHIACDSRSKSEIVIPVYDQERKLVGVLDVDSKEYNSFDDTDAEYLAKIVQLIYK